MLMKQPVGYFKEVNLLCVASIFYNKVFILVPKLMSELRMTTYYT